MDIDEIGVRIQQNIVNQNCVIQSQGHIDINSAVYISNNIVASTAAAMHEHALAAQQQQQSVSQQQQLTAAVETIRVEAERRHAEAMRQHQHESHLQSSQEKQFWISNTGKEHAKQLAEAKLAATAEVDSVLAASAAEINRSNSQNSAFQKEIAKMNEDMLEIQNETLKANRDANEARAQAREAAERTAGGVFEPGNREQDENITANSASAYATAPSHSASQPDVFNSRYQAPNLGLLLAEDFVILPKVQRSAFAGEPQRSEHAGE